MFLLSRLHRLPTCPELSLLWPDAGVRRRARRQITVRPPVPCRLGVLGGFSRALFYSKEGDIEGLKTKMLLLPSFIPSLHAASSLCRRRRRGRPRWWFQISGRACGRTKTRFEPIQTAAEDEAEATTGSITWRGGGQPGLPKG